MHYDMIKKTMVSCVLVIVCYRIVLYIIIIINDIILFNSIWYNIIMILIQHNMIIWYMGVFWHEVTPHAPTMVHFLVGFGATHCRLWFVTPLNDRMMPSQDVTWVTQELYFCKENLVKLIQHFRYFEVGETCAIRQDIQKHWTKLEWGRGPHCERCRIWHDIYYRYAFGTNIAKK